MRTRTQKQPQVKKEPCRVLDDDNVDGVDGSQRVNKNRESEPTMKLFVHFISTEISSKQ